MSRDLRAEVFPRSTASRWLGPVALACWLVAPQPVDAAELCSGLVVETVLPNGAASLAGLEPGDLLLSWEFQPRELAGRNPEAGILDTPFDLIDPFVELLPRGTLTIDGWRQGRARSWTVRSTGSLVLGLEARPAMTMDRWERYHRTLRELRAAVAGQEQPPSFTGLARPTDSPRQAAWYHLRYGEVAASAGHRQAADQAFAEACEILSRDADSSAHAAVLLVWALEHVGREPERAARLFEQALALERQRDPAGLSMAYVLGTQAFYLDHEGDLQTAERLGHERLTILERLAPEGLDVARTLDFLGYLALWRGDTKAAQEHLQRAEAIQRRMAPQSLFFAATLNKLALVAQDLGDFEQAEALKRQTLALNERLAPGSLDHGGSLMNLAETMILRGELAQAEDLLRQSAELIDQPGVDPWVAAGPYANLGALALSRGDLGAARSYFELAISRMRQGPESIELAGVLSNLAEVASKEQRFAESRALERSALEIVERLAVTGAWKAGRLEALARIELEAGGDLVTAEALLRQAVATVLDDAPESAYVIPVRRDLGKVLARTGRLIEAAALYRQILSDLGRRGLAGTMAEAEIRNLLGHVQRQRGELTAAEGSFCRATRLLDLQRSRLGGSLESRNWFESETRSYAFDCLAALAELGRFADAFHVLERGKTRVFLQLLAERDLRLAGLPPELKAERAHLDAEYDRLLSQLGSGNADGTAALRARLEDIKAAREALVARLKRESPQVAALEAPEPLDLAAARRALDPGTVLLAYAVGPEDSYLFVVTPSDQGGRGLEMHRLSIGRDALETAIEAFRRLLSDPQSDLVSLNHRASRLYELLVRPAERRISRARRILIAADGPLHLLPWAALQRRHQFLAQRRPIHLIASMTAYGEIRRQRQPPSDPRTWRLVAFGDPRYPATDGTTLGDSEVRSAVRRGLNLEPLPSTREEILSIAALFPAAEVYLGEEATEERAKQASPRADVLHFASHGLVDERFPLDSALALSVPAQLKEGRDNGLLQAWEIFESLRLGADLVTLSACDTALGKEMGGEGLLGLTRAFQFAGARTVFASLWNVSDDSTSMLMERFYTHLRQGKTKDEALRAAQLDLLRASKSGFSHPFHWAGFALYGDWR